MKMTQFSLCAVLSLASFAAWGQQNTIKLGVAHLDIRSQADNLS
jgi:hypothetical protein